MKDFMSKFSARLMDLSEGKTLHECILEWGFLAPINDKGARISECGLCDTDIRYEYKIKNKFNVNELIVGSTCIKKFLKETKNGQGLLDEIKEAEKEFVEEKIKDMFVLLLNSSYFSATTIYKNKEMTVSKSFYQHYEDNGYFTPFQLRRIGMELQKQGDSAFMKYLKTSLQKPANKNQLLELTQKDFKLIWYSLSSAQRQQRSDYEEVKARMESDHLQD